MSTESITESGHDKVVPPYVRQFVYDPATGHYAAADPAFSQTISDDTVGLIRAAAAADRLLGPDLDLRRRP